MSEAVGREFKRKAKREAKRLAQIHTGKLMTEYSPKKFGPCFRCLILAYKFNMILLRLRLRVTYMQISNIEY